jgi:hypothetical protein
MRPISSCASYDVHKVQAKTKYVTSNMHMSTRHEFQNEDMMYFKAQTFKLKTKHNTMQCICTMQNHALE